MQVGAVIVYTYVYYMLAPPENPTGLNNSTDALSSKALMANGSQNLVSNDPDAEVSIPLIGSEPIPEQPKVPKC